jgi:serine/threonine protein kinase
MGNKPPKGTFDEEIERLEAKTGKIALARWHRLPRKLEDDYKITGKILGFGCNGNVIMAQSRQNKNLKFAIKRLKLAGDANQTAYLKSEVEISLSLDHPRIARLVDVYETDSQLFLVMECMEGGELMDRVKEAKRFSEEEAAHTIWQMLLAVNYLHSHGIVHRDLKLENFLFARNDSNHLNLSTSASAKLGTRLLRLLTAISCLRLVALCTTWPRRS